MPCTSSSQISTYDANFKREDICVFIDSIFGIQGCFPFPCLNDHWGMSYDLLCPSFQLRGHSFSTSDAPQRKWSQEASGWKKIFNRGVNGPFLAMALRREVKINQRLNHLYIIDQGIPNKPTSLGLGPKKISLHKNTITSGVKDPVSEVWEPYFFPSVNVWKLLDPNMLCVTSKGVKSVEAAACSCTAVPRPLPPPCLVSSGCSPRPSTKKYPWCDQHQTTNYSKQKLPCLRVKGAQCCISEPCLLCAWWNQPPVWLSVELIAKTKRRKWRLLHTWIAFCALPKLRHLLPNP